MIIDKAGLEFTYPVLFKESLYCCCLIAQSSPTLCDLPGSSARGSLQARILGRVAVSFSRRSSRPRSPALRADSLPLSHQGSPSLRTCFVNWGGPLFLYFSFSGTTYTSHGLSVL